VSALLTLVGTAGTRAREQPAKVLASGLPTRARAELNVGTFDSRRDFRRSQSSRSTSGVSTCVTEGKPKCKRGARVSLKGFS